jgi:hypothetical protein
MASSNMLRRVALVRTDVSEELSTSFIRVTIGELETTLALTSNRGTLLCKIRGFHGGVYEECRLLGSYVVWLL